MEDAEDEIYRAAKAAAAEAQMRTTKGPTSSLFRKMFRSDQQSGGYSAHGGVVARPAAPTDATAESTAESTAETTTTAETKPETRSEPSVSPGAGVGSLTGWEHQIASDAARDAASPAPSPGGDAAPEIALDGGGTPQPPSPQEKMRRVLVRLAASAGKSIDAVAALRRRRAAAAADLAAAVTAARVARRRAELAERQQTTAADQEDFEAADRCGEAAEEHRVEEERQAEACRFIRGAIAEFDDEVATASAEVAERFAEAHAELTALREDVESSEEGVLEDLVSASRLLGDDADRLDKQRTQVEEEARAWEEESERIHEKIREETRDLEEECAEKR